jgi:hypothetical protein
MPDESYLDEKYFVDPYVYNCPFCNRRHVSYRVVDIAHFNWTPTKECYVYIVRCLSCGNRSMHLSFTQTETQGVPGSFAADAADLDDRFFYSVPTSFFTLDEAIPRAIRDAFAEAEGCLKSNYLTGASACARKGVYELAQDRGATGANYDERIKSLKVAHPQIDPSYFDTLLTIQEVTSEKVHENAYDGWQATHLRLILSALREILGEIYVLPSLRKRKRDAVIDLKKEILGGRKASS